MTMTHRVWLLSWSALSLALVAPGCGKQAKDFAGYPCDAGACAAGFVCRSDTDTCAPVIDLTCPGASCPATVQTGDPCAVALAFVPCLPGVDDCRGGCRTCEDGAWSDCSPCDPGACGPLDHVAEVGCDTEGGQLNCAIVACAPGFTDADGEVDNGCEEACVSTGAEMCDNIDNDCNGVVDDLGDTAIQASCAARFPSAANVDHWACAAGCVIDRCAAGFWDIAGGVANGCEYACTVTGDETCDGVDQDCDGAVDDVEPVALDGECRAVHAGAVNVEVWACVGGACAIGSCVSGWVSLSGDPADGCDTPCIVTVPPDEVCDGADNDCDGQTDPEDAGGCTTYHLDADGDGVGRAGDARCLCAPAGQHTSTANDDCDDEPDGCGAGCFPGNVAPDICDGENQDCDLELDEDPDVIWYADRDGDGFTNPADTQSSCGDPDGAGTTWLASPSAQADCDDDPAACGAGCFPGQVVADTCDGRDQDCDGKVDENPERDWFPDRDDDGYTQAVGIWFACVDPDGVGFRWLADATALDDCDDMLATCTCDTSAACNSDPGGGVCGCDPDCGWPCTCDTDLACQAACACDPDCSVTCACNVNPAACDYDCACDAACGAGCACDTSAACEAGCACDEDCYGCGASCNPGRLWYRDRDLDGFTGSETTISCLDPDGAGGEWRAAATAQADCDDDPGACGADCFPGQTWFWDADLDGYTSAANTVTSCLDPDGAGLEYLLDASATADCHNGIPTCTTNCTTDTDGDAWRGNASVDCVEQFCGTDPANDTSICLRITQSTGTNQPSFAQAITDDNFAAATQDFILIDANLTLDLDADPPNFNSANTVVRQAANTTVDISISSNNNDRTAFDIAASGVQLRGLRLAITETGNNIRGVRVYKGSNPVLTGVVIDGVRMRGTNRLGDGIYIDDRATQVTVRNNVIDVYRYRGIYVTGDNGGGDDSLFADNVVRGGTEGPGNERGGIVLRNVARVSLVGNVIAQSNHDGIQLTDADDVFVDHNTIANLTNASSDGLDVYGTAGSTNLCVRNNIFSEVTRDALAINAAGSSFNAAAACTGALTGGYGNDFFTSGSGALCGGTQCASCVCLPSTGFWELNVAGAFTTTALSAFTPADAGQFYCLGAAALIDVGDDLGYDRNGGQTGNFNGTAPDIGGREAGANGCP